MESILFFQRNVFFFYLISLLHSTLMDLCTKNYSCEKTAVKYVTYNYVKIKHIGTI